MTKITFGTDGWRGIIGEEFTSSNVKVVAQAVADYMKDHGLESRGVVVGYDTRKWARRFKAFRFQCRIRVWCATDKPILQPPSDGDIQASPAQPSEDLGSLETATH